MGFLFSLAVWFFAAYGVVQFICDVADRRSEKRSTVAYDVQQALLDFHRGVRELQEHFDATRQASERKP